jgi:acetyl-CoA carboxylase biotin carboxyl carrier protein
LAELSEADVLRILELVDQSSFDYFDLTLGDLHLTVSKTGLPMPAAAPPAPGASGGAAPPPATAPPSSVPAPPPTPPPPGPPPAGAPAGAAPAGAASAPPAAAPRPASAAGAAAAGLVPVPSPMVGTFYVAPAPDAAPFVEVGGAVQADTTVGLVEAMKMFTGVLAGASGVIAERLVENAQFVEYGQPLFLVRPEGAA